MRGATCIHWHLEAPPTPYRIPVYLFSRVGYETYKNLSYYIFLQGTKTHHNTI